MQNQLSEKLVRFFEEEIAPYIKEKEEESTDKYVVINGLQWARENLNVNGREHFQFDEAQKIADSLGMRLPTKEEWEALYALGSSWDEEREGRWFGKDHAKKGKSRQSIFLPTTGYRASSNGGFNVVGSNGLYWSATANSGAYGYSLGFHSSGVNPSGVANRAYGFAVRCVSEEAV